MLSRCQVHHQASSSILITSTLSRCALTLAIQDVPDLLIAVDVLLIEHLDLLVIAWQLVLADGDDLLWARGSRGRHQASAAQT
jgi:hypothetical protein